MLNGRGKEMKEYKIDLSGYDGKVREVVSEAIQRKAFELGYGWGNGGKSLQLLDVPLLFLDINGFITWGSSKTGSWLNGDNAEISAADFLALTPEDVKDEPKEQEFKPFDRVLVRDTCDRKWRIDFFEEMNKDTDDAYRYRCLKSLWCDCIHYEGNEHLLGTTEGVE